MDDEAIERAADEVAAPFREAKELYMAKEVKEAFIDGAHFAISELTRWRDPAVELPEKNGSCLVKMRILGSFIADEVIALRTFGDRGKFFVDNREFVTGWRPI